MEDLNAASLEDVKEWFKTYYGPSNAVLVIAGDIDAADRAGRRSRSTSATFRPARRCRHIAPGSPSAPASHRAVLQDRVPQARIYKVWNTPPIGQRTTPTIWASPADVLGAGQDLAPLQAAGLRRPDRHRRQRVIGTSGDRRPVPRSTCTARPGVDLARVEKAIDEELQRFLAQGPTADELERVKTRTLASFIRGVERIGGFGGKSDMLAHGQVYAGNPDAYKTTLGDLQTRDGRRPQERGQRSGCRDGVFVLEVHPFPTFKASAADVDRSKLPGAGHASRLASSPSFSARHCRNGLKVILAERHGIPVVNVTWLVDAGYRRGPALRAGHRRVSP